MSSDERALWQAAKVCSCGQCSLGSVSTLRRPAEPVCGSVVSFVSTLTTDRGGGQPWPTNILLSQATKLGVSSSRHVWPDPESGYEVAGAHAMRPFATRTQASRSSVCPTRSQRCVRPEMMRSFRTSRPPPLGVMVGCGARPPRRIALILQVDIYK